jgi:hypothetical protein
VPVKEAAVNEAVKVPASSEVWPLKDEKLAFGIKLKGQVAAGQEVFLTYGNRANSYLLVQYGFCIEDNEYDFVRVQDVTIKSFLGEKEDLSEKVDTFL